MSSSGRPKHSPRRAIFVIAAALQRIAALMVLRGTHRGSLRVLRGTLSGHSKGMAAALQCTHSRGSNSKADRRRGGDVRNHDRVRWVPQ